MKKFIFLLFLFFTISNTFAQSLNDFRTRPSLIPPPGQPSQQRDWNQQNVWQIFDGTTWVDTTQHPGSTVTNNVFIQNQAFIVLRNLNLTQPINSITLGDESSVGVETLLISQDTTIPTTQFTIAYDGFLSWDGNRTLTLPAGANFVVEPTEPSTGLVLGVTHGLDQTPPGNGNTCNSSKRIDIGNVTYSNCSGNGGAGGNALSFETVNDNGGLLNVNPATNTSPCRNKTLQLTTTLSGTESNATPITYNWTVTPPSGASYNLTGENPTDTPTGFGSYIYEVAATNDSGITDTDSVIVEVESCRTVVTNRRITYRVNGGTAISTTPTIGNEITDDVTIQGVRDSNNNEGEITFFNDNGNPTYIEIEILLSDVPYDTITITSLIIGNPPAINLNNVSFTMGPTITGSPGNFDYLFSIVGITISSNQQLQLKYTTNVNGNNNNPCPTGGPCAIEIFGIEQ